MGQIHNKTNQTDVVDLIINYNIRDLVLSQDDFEYLCNAYPILLHKQMIDTNVFAKIYICENNEKYNNVNKLNKYEKAEEYMDHYYVAHLFAFNPLKNKQYDENNKYNCVYGFDIYLYNKKTNNKKPVIIKYGICRNIHECKKYIKYSNNFHSIFKVIKNLNADKICDILCKKMNKQIYERRNKYVNIPLVKEEEYFPTSILNSVSFECLSEDDKKIVEEYEVHRYEINYLNRRKSFIIKAYLFGFNYPGYKNMFIDENDYEKWRKKYYNETRKIINDTFDNIDVEKLFAMI